jgi:molecular chaperone DnaK (HSP70)
LKLIHDSINEALILSNLHSGQIDKVIMNWGTSLVPIIQNLVNEIVWKGKILSWNTFSAVWHWLTLESFEKFK